MEVSQNGGDKLDVLLRFQVNVSDVIGEVVETMTYCRFGQVQDRSNVDDRWMIQLFDVRRQTRLAIQPIVILGYRTLALISLPSVRVQNL